MAYEIPGLCVSLPAAADLSSSQFMAVKVDNTGKIALAVAGDAVLGILQDTPKSGEYGSVMLYGVSKMVTGAGGVTAGDLVASDAAAKAKTAVKGNTDTTSGSDSATEALKGSNVLGVALETGAAAQVISVALLRMGLVPTTVQ